MLGSVLKSFTSQANHMENLRPEVSHAPWEDKHPPSPGKAAACAHATCPQGAMQEASGKCGHGGCFWRRRLCCAHVGIFYCLLL